MFYYRYKHTIAIAKHTCTIAINTPRHNLSQGIFSPFCFMVIMAYMYI